MPELTWLPNLGSQLDRALRAYFVASGAATFHQVFTGNDYRPRNAPLIQIHAHTGEPSPTFSGCTDFMVDLFFKFQAKPPQGHANPASYQLELDKFIGRITYLMFLGDYDDGLPTVCSALTTAGRNLKTSGSSQDQANNPDMADFTVRFITPGDENRANPANESGVDENWWVERRTWRITAMSAAIE